MMRTVAIKAIGSLTAADAICKTCKESEIEQRKMMEKFKTRLVNSAAKFSNQWQEDYDEMLQQAVKDRLNKEGR